MYKFSYVSTLSRYNLSSQLEKIVSDNEENLLKNIEYSLLLDAYEQEMKNSKIEDKYNNIEVMQKKLKYELIKQRIKQLEETTELEKILSVSKSKSKLMLITLYEYLLNEEMKQKKDIGLINKIQSNFKVEKPFQNLEEFIISKDNTNYVRNLKQELKKILTDKELIKKYYIDRPVYFLLYRIRNNIIKELKNKEKYSLEYVKKIIKELKNINKNNILDFINENYINNIKNLVEINNDIYEYIINELIEFMLSGTLNKDYNERQNKLKELIESNPKIIEIKQAYIKQTENIYNNSIQQENIEVTVYKLIQCVSNVLLEEKKELDIPIDFFKDEVKNYAKILYASKILDELKNDFNIDYKKINNQTLYEIKRKYFKRVKYNILIPLKNIDIQERLIEKNNIIFFPINQINKFINLEEQEIINTKLGKSSIYALVKDVEVLEGEYEKAIEKAENKIKITTAIIENFMYRKDNKKIKFLEERYVLKNKEIMSISRPNTYGALDIKIIEDKYFDKLFETKDYEKIVSIGNTLNKLFNLGNSKSLKDLNDCYCELYVNSKIKDNALFNTILIAGSNIYKYDNVSYFKLRLWLYEDYLELFRNEIREDGFMFDRFFTFEKTIITTLLSYSDLFNKNIENNIQNWILKVYPNDYSRRLIK